MPWILSALIAGESAFLLLPQLPSAIWLWCIAAGAFCLSIFLTFRLYASGQEKTEKQKTASLKSETIKTIDLKIGNLKIAYIKISYQKLLTWSVACLISFLIGTLWSFYLNQSRSSSVLPEELEGVDLMVEGIVDGLPQDNNEGRRFTLKVIAWSSPQVDDLDWQQPITGKFPNRISLGWYGARENFFAGASKQPVDLSKIPLLIPGERWRLPVRLKRPRGQLNPHGFDYERWMFMQDLGANGSVMTGRSARGTFQAEKMADWELDFQASVERIRWHLRRKILSTLPKDAAYAGVLAALVMGDQNAIAQEDWVMFNATGIGHLISISGLHVTMLAGFGGFIVNRLWRRGRLPLLMPAQKMGALAGFITAFIYTWLAGFQIPAQRTMMMVGVVAIALWNGRRVKPFDIWWWALGLVVSLNPWSIYTPGFWLSFGAVALILFAMPSDQKYRDHEVPDVDKILLNRCKESLAEACRVQAVVTIGLIPMTLWWFSQMSLISPFANAFAIPLVSFVVTPLAMLGAVLPWIFGEVCLWIAHTSIDWMVVLLRPMSAWDWSVIHASKPSFWMLVLSMVGVLIAIRPGPLNLNWKSRISGLLLCGGLFLPKWNFISEGDFEVLAWDIGQGTAILVRTSNHQMLYDAGPVSSASNDPGVRILLPYLRAEGITHLDRLALSHRDSDHIGGVESLLKGIPMTDVRASIPEWHPLQKAFNEANVPAQPCQAGHSWEWDGVKFIIWHPAPRMTFASEFHEGKPNELSCVIEVRNQFHSFWLTGDVEKNGEREITERLQGDVLALKELESRNKVFMAPHHGSNTSSTPIFLNTLMPNWAFSQTGYKNRYRHPHPFVISRYQNMGISLLDTSQTGAQIWRFEQENMHFEDERNSKRRIWYR